jgi:hypothetical protein
MTKELERLMKLILTEMQATNRKLDDVRTELQTLNAALAGNGPMVRIEYPNQPPVVSTTTLEALQRVAETLGTQRNPRA